MGFSFHFLSWYPALYIELYSPDRQWCPDSIHTLRSKGCGSTQFKGCGSTWFKGCGSTQDIIDGPDCILHAWNYTVEYSRQVLTSILSLGKKIWWRRSLLLKVIWLYFTIIFENRHKATGCTSICTVVQSNWREFQ